MIAVLLAERGCHRPVNLKINIFFLIYHEEESVQRLYLHKICLPGYQVTSLSPAITASQPLLRSETLFPPFIHENLWIAVGISSSKHELICKEKKKKHIWGNTGHTDLAIRSGYSLSKILTGFTCARSAIPKLGI